MAKRLTNYDAQDIARQLQEILAPNKVVDVGIDPKRMVAYAAVAFHGAGRGNDYLPDGAVFACVAPIYEADDYDKRIWRHNFVVTSDAMPAESMGICITKRYCHCPAHILDKLSTPKNELAAKWRGACRRNLYR